MPFEELLEISSNCLQEGQETSISTKKSKDFCRISMSFLIKYKAIGIFQFLSLVVFLDLPLVYPLNGRFVFVLFFFYVSKW